MKVKLRRGVLALAALLLFGVVAFAPSQAHASGEQFLFAYPEKAVDDIKSDIDGNKKSNDVMQVTSVWVKGGVFGDTQFKLPFSNQQNDNEREYVYAQTYDCTNSGLVQGSVIPRPGVKFYKVTLAARVKLDSGFNDKNPTGFAAVPRLIIKDGDNEETFGSNGRAVNLNDLPRACKPSIGNITLKNYQKLSDSEKSQWGTAKTEVDREQASYRTASSTGDGDSEPTCQSEGGALAWMMCPTIDLIHDTVGALMKDFILNQLEYDPLSVDPNGGATASNNIYAIWQAIRNLANVLFVLIFLFIVFANTVGMNVNAYTVKKMLPRLVAAVLLVQLSFLISALIIDAGNIAGQGIGALITQALPASATEGAGSGLGIGWNVLTNSLLGVLAVGIIIKVGIATVLLLAVAAVISVLSVVITLVLRDLIISVLVITSPLAFAAWVLPGTQKVFQTWWRLFIRIIIMYPMIALLFSMSSVLSAASTGATGGEGLVQAIIAGIFPIIAFFMVPWTFKWAGGAMAMTAGYVSGIANRTGGAVDRGLRNSRPYQANQQRLQARRDLRGSQKIVNQLGSRNPLRKAWGTYKVSGAPLGGRFNGNGGWGSTSPAVQQNIDDAIKQARETAQNQLQNTGTQDLKNKFAATDASGKLKNKTMGVAAIGELAKRGELTGQHLAAIQKTYGAGSREATIAMKYAQGQMSDKAKEKHPVLAYAGSKSEIDATGKFTRLDEEDHKKIMANVNSPKELGKLSKEGMDALTQATVKDKKGNDLTFNTASGTQKKTALNGIDKHVLESVLNDPKLQNNMHPDVLQEIRNEHARRP